MKQKLLAGSVYILICLTSGCHNMDRIATLGTPPALSTIENPHNKNDYKPVSMPTPSETETLTQANSLWRPGAKAFFKDQRARRVGDILTVFISINDKAEIDNTSTRSRNNSDAARLPNFLGYEAELHKILPDAVNANNLVNLSSQTANNGTGSVDREEKIELKIAAIITQVLPNGNLVIDGKQEVVVNHELRDLNITGIIRPEDVTAQNNISYEKIAEARISYGGKGLISDVQQPRFGQQLYDMVFPF